MGLWHTDYQYDQNSRLTAYTRSTPTSTRTTTFTLDLVGNRTAEQEVGEGYLRDRVYTLTDAGHRISHFTETVTENDTLTLDRVVSYTYDANGNRLSKTSADQVGKHAVSLTMIWDARNRLRRVDQDGIAALHFDYDDLDRRIRKSGGSQEADPILYLWDELAVLTELREGTGGNEPSVIASYAFGLTRLALKRADSGDQWFHHDMLGSIADLSDARGAVVEAKTFTPYGKQETISSSAEGGYNRYGYTGHEYDEETDLTYAKARFYDQDLGIFASADPVLGQFDRPPSLHRFIYGFSNPLSFYDPTGETADEIFDSWLTGIAQEEESAWREPKALAVIGWASVYKFGDMLTYGSAHRISEDTDEYMAGELSTGEYMAEVMGQVAIAGAGTAANIALGAGAIGAVTRVGLTGIGAGIAAGAITGAGGTLIQDVINISQGEQEGLSSLETYATSTIMGGAMGGIMAAAAKIDARMAQSNRNTPKSTASDEPSTGPAPQSQSDRIRANLEKSRAGRPSEGFKRYAARERAHNKLRKTKETRANSNFKTHTNRERFLNKLIKTKEIRAKSNFDKHVKREKAIHKSGERRLIVGAGEKRYGDAYRKGDVTIDIDEKAVPTHVADIRNTKEINNLKLGKFDHIEFELVPSPILISGESIPANLATLSEPNTTVKIITGLFRGKSKDFPTQLIDALEPELSDSAFEQCG